MGPNGTRKTDDYEAITNSLPQEWFSKIISLPRNIVYINTDEAWRSTVHPARFTDTSSEVSSRLPDGWERRLDSWGNLFFVDHHTKSATREDPRFNKKVDQDTGLPVGWRSIKDYKDTEFFFRKQGRMIVGTYDATALNSKDLRHKKFIDTEPKDGEKPKISDLGRDLLGQPKTEQLSTAPPPPPSSSAVQPPVKAQVAENRASEALSPASTVKPVTDLTPMTEDEKAKYYAMFDAAHKESK